jgi:hypothetical protein
LAENKDCSRLEVLVALVEEEATVLAVECLLVLGELEELGRLGQEPPALLLRLAGR